ncbi:Myotubularin [Entamoeba marina]
MKQFPTKLLNIDNSTIQKDQVIKLLTELSYYKQHAHNQRLLVSIASSDQMSTQQLSYSTLDYLIGVVYMSMPTSPETMYLSTYHFNQFLQLMVRIDICSLDQYNSLLCGTQDNSAIPLHFHIDQELLQNKLRDFVHISLRHHHSFNEEMLLLGATPEFDYDTYNTNFRLLNIIVLGVNLPDLSRFFLTPNATLRPRQAQTPRPLPPPKMTCDESVILPAINSTEIIVVAPLDVAIVSRSDMVDGHTQHGKILVTTYKICYVDKEEGTNNFLIPLMKIADVKKLNGQKGDFKRVLEITIKECITALSTLIFTSPESLGVFQFPLKLDDFSPYPTQRYYDLANEYIRLSLNAPHTHWRITKINMDYSFSPTYPKELIVPREASDDLLIEASQFRSRSRIPVLTWSSSNGATITRSSQPLPGLSSVKCAADVEYLRCIARAVNTQQNNNQNEDSNKKLRILDFRPMVNAVANLAVGGGFETVKDYPFATMEFESIANIHVVREAWTKLLCACITLTKGTTTQMILNTNEVQQWWKVTAAILSSAVKMCKYLENGESVLIHCTDGWDRTSQCSSICQLMIDSYYRTIQGFIILIEKDWKSFGHKFMTRAGVGMKSNPQNSPVFHQFVECVYLLLKKYPTAFEFNEYFLLKLDDAIFASDFGTFLFDCEREREAAHVIDRCPSFWKYVFDNEHLFKNEAFEPTEAKLHEDGVPRFVLWEKYYYKNRKM